MRTLAGALTTAQQAASHEPSVAVTVRNDIFSIRRLDFTVIDSTSNTIAKHDVAVAGDGSVTRIRSDGAGNILIQRNTTPGSGAGYAAAWTNTAAGRGSQVAACAIGARVLIVYTSAAGTVIHWKESTDNGASYGAEQSFAAVGSAVNDLAATYKAAGGDCLIAYVRGTNTLGVFRRVAGAFGAAAESATGTASMNGIAAAYTGDYVFIITGTENTTTHATVWSHAYGDGFEVTAATFGTLRVQHQAESDSLITFACPSALYFDTFRYVFREDDTFTGGNARVNRSWVHPSISVIGAAYTHKAPVPVNYSSTQGLAIASEGLAGYVYETAPNIVQRAAYSAVSDDVTDDVVAAHIEERGRSTSGYIDLDNSRGLYAGPPAPIQLGNELDVRWGYNTTSGILTSHMQDLAIAGYEYRRSGGRSVLRLHVEGGWEQLARARQRGTFATSGISYLTTLARIFARAGMCLLSSSPSSRSSSVSPANFIIAPDTPARTSIERMLDQLADRIRMTTDACATITEPLAAAATTYTFGTTHPLNEAQLLAEPPDVTHVAALGDAAHGEAFDYATAEQSLGTRVVVRDLTSVAGATAAATAAAHLRQRALDADAGALIAPPHCGAELLDLVDFTDLLISASAVKRRVAAIRWDYDQHAGKYEQRLTLGAA